MWRFCDCRNFIKNNCDFRTRLYFRQSVCISLFVSLCTSNTRSNLWVVLFTLYYTTSHLFTKNAKDIVSTGVRFSWSQNRSPQRECANFSLCQHVDEQYGNNVQWQRNKWHRNRMKSLESTKCNARNVLAKVLN